jgi:uncharacterized damage-inducible protein DinB
MSDRVRWFDRVFALETEVSLLPNVIERLRGTPGRLEELAQGVPTEIRLANSDGAWSIQENVGHFLDLEPLWAGRLDDLLAGAEVLRQADLTNAQTDQAKHNSATLADLLTGFRKLRMTLVRRFEGLDGEQQLVHARHPRLDQPMRSVDLALFVAEHDDHHLAGIRRAIRAGGSLW